MVKYRLLDKIIRHDWDYWGMKLISKNFTNHLYQRFFIAISLFLVCFWLVFVSMPAFSAIADKDFETSAAQALLVDKETGSVLFEKQANSRIAPASLTKLMSAEVILHALKHNKISLDDEYIISEDTWRRGGAPSRTTTMFAAVKSKVSVNNLLLGLIVLQANDAALALAEGAFGSEEAFVYKMNERAAEIGLKNSHFVNATGLPQDGQYTTLKDLALLGAYLEKEYPDQITLYSQPAFEWNKIFQRNRNPLVAANIGVIGMANGFTQGQGYSIFLSVEKNDRKLFLALAGVPKEKERNEEAIRIITWAMNEFVSRLVFDKGENIGQAKLFGGDNTTIGLKVNEVVAVLIPKTKIKQVEAKISYEGPITAPVEANKRVGLVKILLNGDSILERPVFTGETATEASITQKAKNSLYELSIGWIRAYWN